MQLCLLNHSFGFSEPMRLVNALPWPNFNQVDQNMSSTTCTTIPTRVSEKGKLFYSWLMSIRWLVSMSIWLSSNIIEANEEKKCIHYALDASLMGGGEGSYFVVLVFKTNCVSWCKLNCNNLWFITMHNCTIFF